MRTAPWHRILLLLAALVWIAACSGDSVTPTGKLDVPPPPKVKQPFPAPSPEVADEIRELVKGSVEERSDESGVYDIPRRGGHDVSGSLAELRTVSQKDADTYTVDADFTSDEDRYEVTVYVDRGPEGLQVRDAFLFKINGKVVSG